jgi:hypothetical protein
MCVESGTVYRWGDIMQAGMRGCGLCTAEVGGRIASAVHQQQQVEDVCLSAQC